MGELTQEPHENLPVGLASVRLAQRAIDQVVVDGLVDGADRRVPIGVLNRCAFQGQRAPTQLYRSFVVALVEDWRFVDKVDTNYGYRPMLEAGSRVRPSLIGIMGGLALCTDAEREAAFSLMHDLANAVYANSDRTVISRNGLTAVLKQAGFVDITYDQFGAFIKFMDRDPRFDLQPDGRIRLTRRVVAKRPTLRAVGPPLEASVDERHADEEPSEPRRPAPDASLTLEQKLKGLGTGHLGKNSGRGNKRGKR